MEMNIENVTVENEDFNPFEAISGDLKKLFANVWNLRIVTTLCDGAKKRFCELQQAIRSSHQTLNNHLRFLKSAGIIQRESNRGIPPLILYSLTDLGRRLFDLLKSLKNWSADYYIYIYAKSGHSKKNSLDVKENKTKKVKKEKKPMNQDNLRKLLREYKDGTISETAALTQLKNISLNGVENLGFAAVDHARELRQGFPEVVYAAGKTKAQLRTIFKSLYDRSDGNLIATRATLEQFEFLKDAVPAATFDTAARMIYVDRKILNRRKDKKIMVVTAGTSDVPVAEEARLTAHLLGNYVTTAYDCGVAGIHRLFAHVDEIQTANVLIVVAGMEGALASVVGGLTDKPVIAVPTSIGYGASFNGLAALLAMLNSCAAGVSVVNIDNGFGAGVIASKINRLSCS